MPTAAMLLHLSVVILAEYIYRKIAKIPRPLLYLELQNNWRKYAKNILCYLGKILNITLIIKDHQHWVFNITSSCLRDSTVLQMYTLLSHPPLLSYHHKNELLNYFIWGYFFVSFWVKHNFETIFSRPSLLWSCFECLRNMFLIDILLW